MGKEKFLVDPEENGIKFGTAGASTERGWKIVTPDTWYFRNHQVSDKAQTVEGYTDPDYYMDCTKAKIICDVYEDKPFDSPGELHAEVLKTLS